MRNKLRGEAQLVVYVSEAVLADIIEQAEAVGLSRSAWVRSKLIPHLAKKPEDATAAA